MPVITSMTAELTEYIRAREALTALEQHLDDPKLWVNVLEPSEISLVCLDDVVGTLCQQARAAQRLATAAEALCASVVGGSHYSTG